MSRAFGPKRPGRDVFLASPSPHRLGRLRHRAAGASFTRMWGRDLDRDPIDEDGSARYPCLYCGREFYDVRSARPGAHDCVADPDYGEGDESG